MIVEGLIAHLVGDYLLQSDWASTEKTRRWWPAVVHALTYGLPFLILTRSPWALLVIVGTHLLIDRYRLARHVIWLKNCVAPRGWNPPWRKCRATGFPPDKDPALAFGLLIVIDNTMHVVINSAALVWLA